MPAEVALSFRELRQLASRWQRCRLAAGELLFREGTLDDDIYLIRRGSVEIFRRPLLAEEEQSAPGEHRLGVQGAGDLVGEMDSFSGAVRAASGRALESLELRKIDRASLAQFLATRPDLAYQLQREMVRRLRESQTELIEQLSRKIVQLEQLNRELEGRVEQRTRDLAVANSRLAQAAVTDFLTGCFNRRFFQEELERLWQAESPFALLIMDLDHFKHYNDTQGHPAGDRLLQEVSALFRATLREGDVLARYGGEEFVCLIPLANPGLALEVAQRLRSLVEVHEFEGGASQPLGRITLSGGVACFPSEAHSPTTLLKLADTRLYRAKQGGRNRIVGGEGEPYHL